MIANIPTWVYRYNRG